MYNQKQNVVSHRTSWSKYHWLRRFNFWIKLRHLHRGRGGAITTTTAICPRANFTFGWLPLGSKLKIGDRTSTIRLRGITRDSVAATIQAD